jgi:hypothetical protein
MLPSRRSSPCLRGARSHTSSIFWVRGSNHSKRKSMKWREMEDLALGRTLEPLAVLMYMYKNMHASVRLLVSFFGGCKDPHFELFLGTWL